jgi:hypothetical protein
MGSAHHEHIFIAHQHAFSVQRCHARAVCDDITYVQFMLDFESALARAETASAARRKKPPLRSATPAS